MRSHIIIFEKYSPWRQRTKNKSTFFDDAKRDAKYILHSRLIVEKRHISFLRKHVKMSNLVYESVVKKKKKKKKSQRK